MFARHDLDELVACDKQPAVSIYMPTHAAGREVRQDAIRLRNLLNTATKRLGADHRPPEIAELLDPARLLVDDEEFWRYQERGLAVFRRRIVRRGAFLHPAPIAAGAPRGAVLAIDDQRRPHPPVPGLAVEL